MEAETSPPVSGNAIAASRDTRGWFLGHFMPGEDNPLRISELELKWYTHAKGGSAHKRWVKLPGVAGLRAAANTAPSRH